MIRSSTFPTFPAPLLVTLLAVLLLAVPTTGHTRSIQITGAYAHQSGAEYHLHSEGDISLSSVVIQALHSGVTVDFLAELRVLRDRRWLWKKRLARYQRRASVSYHELTRHYRVSVIGEEKVRNFRSINDAMKYVANINGMSLPNLSAIAEKNAGRLAGELDMRLDISALPAPLRPQSLVDPAWQLESNEYKWRIN